MGKRLWSVLATVALVGGLISIGSPASAATTYEIQMGAEFGEFPDGRRVPGFSNRIYPGSVSVQTGDILHFAGGGPILLPEGRGPTDWREDNQAELSDPFFFVASDPDDGAEELKFNSAIALGNTFGACGFSAAEACPWDGSDPNAALSAGFFVAPEFFVEITAAPGSRIYAIHALGSRSNFRIDVVGNPGDASTQEELDERAAGLLDQDYEDAAALHKKYSTKRTSHRDDRGRKVYDAWAGVDTDYISLLAMYPRNLTIRRNQRVQWHFNLENEFHSVALPFDRARDEFRQDFLFMCDPDGDAGLGPDTEATFDDQGNPECPGGLAELEIDMNPDAQLERGNGRFTGGNDYENSGTRANESLQEGFMSEAPYTLQFTKVNREGTRYFCLIHGPFMGGRVKVKPAR